MTAKLETSLLENLVNRAVEKKLLPLHEQLLLQHCLLLELVRQLPRQSLLNAARHMDQQKVRADWHLYLCQLAGVVDGDSLPQALQA